MTKDKKQKFFSVLLAGGLNRETNGTIFYGFFPELWNALYRGAQIGEIQTKGLSPWLSTGKWTSVIRELLDSPLTIQCLQKCRANRERLLTSIQPSAWLANFLGIAIVLVFLLSGCGGSGFIATKGLDLLPAQPSTGPDAAMFVAKQAPVMASLLVNPQKFEQFLQGVSPSKDWQRFSAYLAQIKQSLLVNTDLNYADDIETWLGDEITFAVTTLDIDRDASNGAEPGYLVAVATQDPKSSRDFLERFWESQPLAGNDLVLEDYAGVKLIYSRGENWSSAVVGDRFVLFANHPKVLKDAINNVQVSHLSLKNDRAYEQALENLGTGRVGLMFVNLPELGSLLSKQPSLSFVPGSELLDDEETKLQGYESVAIALQVNPQGLLAQTVWQGMTATEGADVPPTLGTPVTALQYLPESVSVVASGTDLSQLWTDFFADMGAAHRIGGLVQQPLTDVQARWEIDLPQDIFSWVTGEYVLGLLPRDDNDKNLVNLDWIFVAQKGETAEAGIENLDAIAQQHGFSIGAVALDHQPIAAWTKLTTTTAGKSGPLILKAQVEGTHASVGQYEILTSSIDAMEAALNAAQSGSLLQSDQFTTTIAPLSTPNYGYAYLEWKTTQAILEQRFPILKLFFDLAGQPILENLRAVALSSSGDNRLNFFFRLGQ